MAGNKLALQEGDPGGIGTHVHYAKHVIVMLLSLKTWQNCIYVFEKSLAILVVVFSNPNPKRVYSYPL